MTNSEKDLKIENLLVTIDNVTKSVENALPILSELALKIPEISTLKNELTSILKIHK